VDIPLVLMGYYNPMLAFGLEKLVADARAADVDGFIIPDLPPEEDDEFLSAMDGSHLPLIRMLAPTTPAARMELVARGAQGFIYLVSVTGVTGARQSLANGLPELIMRVREHTSVPVCVGFGISTPEQAKAIGTVADGVIVGSACVRSIGESKNPIEAARELSRSFREALRNH
jgi:tryptophan synthase alpha chain